MTVRNLDALFAPKSIALIGASNRPGTVGSVLARNLFRAGFQGPVMPINPHEEVIGSTVNYRSVADLPLDPDLAVIATPAASVPALVAELGERGCRAAVVISSGFSPSLRDELLAAARPHLMRIVGPSCVGFVSPQRGINASIAHITPRAGDLAFVSQSGPLALAVLDWADAHGVGFSHLLSIGDMSDVDIGDLLDHLAQDGRTRAILLYAESITGARKFMSAARIAARIKPVVIIKSGRTEAGARAAMSHTGVLAGSDAVCDAAFRRAGMLRVASLRELFEAVGTLACQVRPRGNRLAILTNSGGAGVLATDALEDHGATLAALAPETLSQLEALLPADWSHGNPVEILREATGERYEKALKAILPDHEQDAVLVMNCPTATTDGLDAARATVAALGSTRRVPILTCWMGASTAEPARRLFAERAVPTYETPDGAVRAFMHLVEYRRNQDLLMQTPPPLKVNPAHRETARVLVEEALREGRDVLTEPEAKQLLAAYEIPVVDTRIVTTPQEAAAAAEEIGYPVALKILSRDISHKSEVGGVQLELDSPEAVRIAASDMLDLVRQRKPKAQVDGFTVQQMIVRAHAHELLVGIAEDPNFGPVVLVGQGGTAAEVIADRAVGLPPLNMVLAHDMIARTRVSRLLRGYRERPAADMDAIAHTLVKLSQMAADFAEIAELDINPLLADHSGVIALDGRVVVRPKPAAGTARFAIRPYPEELERDITLRAGAGYHIRPIRPEDEPALIEMLERSSPEDLVLRFFAPVKRIDHSFVARLTQIDYEREMAFVIKPDASMEAPILGAARIIADPDNEAAEYGIMVRSDMKGHGIGSALMRHLLVYGKARGLKRVFGDVLYENRGMIDLAGRLGFSRHVDENDPQICRVEIDLATIDPNLAG
ncbi:GNAT family N-acetyltransferase [Consotaella salsifontis]|uniref:Acetyltransferase n=1 Tax=Consotaella salsifontis TaxID=1365950 RepID=A0A1T4MGI4_9HYPH|nr:GNAT family N-acetyltransferase [Consotaella salsifontis]SJZ65975.1 acetyltransferase [Consotaella salsifontis]